MSVLDRIVRRTAPTSGLEDAQYNGGREPWNSGSASNQFADLLRDQWADYVDRFASYEQKLYDMAMGNEDNLEAEARAREMSGIAHQNADSAYQRDLSRMGLSESSGEIANRQRTSALSKTAAEVDAVNRTRMHAKDRDMQIIAGGLSGGLRDVDMGVGQ